MNGSSPAVSDRGLLSAPVPPASRSEPPPSSGPLRVAFFTDTFVPTHDGVAQVSEGLALGLARLGHHVTVYTVHAPGLRRSETGPDGLTIRRFLSVPAPQYPQYRVAVTPWTILLSSRGRFDVVHIHTPGFVGLAGWLAGRAWAVPTVGTYHTNLTDMLRNVGTTRAERSFFRSWSRFSVDLCLRCDLATAPSEAALGALIRSDPVSTRLRPRLVSNGVDTERFRPGISSPDWRARLQLGSAPLITFLGRLTQDKGVGRFLDGLDRLGDGLAWSAVIAGEGPERSTVLARLRASPRLSERTRFVGGVVETDKPALLAQSQVFVLPSLSDTSSVALLEAMAAGAPTVVTAFGGPAELATASSAGLVVDPRDPDELAGAVARFLREPDLARDRSRKGREWVVAHASLTRMAAGFHECYQAVVRARRG